MCLFNIPLSNCPNLLYKVKPKGKVRWTGSRTRGRWKYSSNDESEGSDSEKSSAASEEEEGKESEEAILADDDEPCKKCGLPNHPELVRADPNERCSYYSHITVA